MKKYSFVIPSYNYKNYIVNCIKALDDQVGFGPEDYEVIVVDDGSSDGTGDSIHQMNLTIKPKYIYIERTKESCRNAARNRGWKAAEGEIIIFLDADMIVNRDYLKNLDMCYKDDRDIAVAGLRFMLHEPVDQEEIADHDIFRKINIKNPDMKYYEERHYFLNKLSYNTSAFDNVWIYFYSCNISVPRRVLEKIGGFNERLSGWGFDDQEFGYRLTRAGVKIIINQKLEGLHQFHNEIYGTPSNPKKILQWYENVCTTYKIHADIKIALPKTKLLFCYAFMLIPWMNKRKRRKTGLQKHTIHVMKQGTIDEYKSTLKKLSSEKNNKIIVYDYLENTDLHIWVQLLGETESPVQYFPVSRVLAREKVTAYHKHLKKLYPQNRIAYLIKMFFLTLKKAAD